MAAWGEEGFAALSEFALGHPKVGPKTAAFMVLARIAATGTLPNSFFKGNPILAGEEALAGAVNRKLSAIAARVLARKALNELLRTVPQDELFVAFSQAFMYLFVDENNEVAEELVASLSTRWFRFGQPAIAEYERLIRHEPGNEPAFQDFFSRYPQLLDPMAVKVWSQPDFHGALEPDFVVRRADDSYLVIEIECPGKQLVTKAGQLASATLHAEKQALDYEAFLAERVTEARWHFPEYSRADCLVVVGMEAELMPSQRRGLQMANSRRQNLRIVGFDWLLHRARAVVANVGQGKVEVLKGYRLL